jgi:hypothetical protein
MYLFLTIFEQKTSTISLSDVEHLLHDVSKNHSEAFDPNKSGIQATPFL